MTVKALWSTYGQPLMKRHVAACALALLVGVLSIAPHLFAVQAIGDAYKGIPFLPLDNEDEYLVRIQEVVDGYWNISSAFYFEYKDFPSYLPPYAEYVYAIPATVLHVPAVTVLITAKAILPAILLLLVYALIFRILSSLGREAGRWSAIAGGLWITLCYQFLPLQFVQQWLQGSPLSFEVSIWTRPVNPIIGALLLFAFLHLYWSFLQRPRVYHAVVGGVLVLLLTSYIFTWAIVVTLVVLTGVVALLRKEFIFAKKIGWLFLAVVLASLPAYAPMVLQALSGVSSAGRNGAEYTHIPLLNKFVLAGIVLFFVFAVIAKSRVYVSEDIARKGIWSWMFSTPTWLFCAVVLATSFIVYVQNVVTGISVWPHHFVQYTKPLVVLVLFISGALALGKARPRVWKVVVVVTSILAIVNGVVTVYAFRGKVDGFIAQQRYAPSLQWLREHAPKDCVVLVYEEGDELSGYVPALTSCNLYLSHWQFSGVPRERIEHDFFVKLRLAGVSATSVRSYLYEHEEAVRSGLFEDWDQIMNRGTDAWLEATVERIASEYPEIVSEPLPAMLQRYRLDYLLTEQELSPEILRDWGVAEQIGDFDGVRLYEFAH